MPKWEDIREDLFEAVIQVHPAMNKEQQAEVVNIMRSKGHEMGWNAIRQHLQKLRRKEDKAGGGSNGEGGGPSSAPVTPKTPGGRKKNVGGVKKEPGSGTKRKPVALSDDEEDVKPARVKKVKEEPVKEESEGSAYV